MASETGIVNIALGRIGGTRITSLTDGSANANYANDIYDDLRDSLLRSHPWNFAIERVKLAQSATTPSFEFDFAYPLPSDWIRTVSVHDNDAGHGTVLYRTEYHVNQRAIIASSDQIYLRYVYRVTDANQMDDLFVEALSFALARDLAIPVASSRTLRDTMAIEFRRIMAHARSTDAMGSFPELRPRGSWAAARGGWRRDDFLSD